MDDDDTDALGSSASLASSHTSCPEDEDEDDEDQDEIELEKLRPQIELDQSAQVDRDDDPNFQEKSIESNPAHGKHDNEEEDVEHSVILANFTDGQRESEAITKEEEETKSQPSAPVFLTEEEQTQLCKQHMEQYLCDKYGFSPADLKRACQIISDFEDG